MRTGLAGVEGAGWWKGIWSERKEEASLHLTVKHGRRQPPGVLCQLLSTEDAARTWGPCSAPTASQVLPRGAEGRLAQKAGGLAGSAAPHSARLFSALWFKIRFTKEDGRAFLNRPAVLAAGLAGLLLLGRLESLSEASLRSELCSLDMRLQLLIQIRRYFQM